VSLPTNAGAASPDPGAVFEFGPPALIKFHAAPPARTIAVARTAPPNNQSFDRSRRALLLLPPGGGVAPPAGRLPVSSPARLPGRWRGFFGNELCPVPVRR